MIFLTVVAHLIIATGSRPTASCYLGDDDDDDFVFFPPLDRRPVNVYSRRLYIITRHPFWDALDTTFIRFVPNKSIHGSLNRHCMGL